MPVSGNKGDEGPLHVNSSAGKEESRGSDSKKFGEGWDNFFGKSKEVPRADLGFGPGPEDGNKDKNDIFFFNSHKKSKRRRVKNVSGPSSISASPVIIMDSSEKSRPSKRSRAQVEDLSDPFSLDKLLNRLNTKNDKADILKSSGREDGAGGTMSPIVRSR
ncbi:hypothetical protein Hanom_Chr16g01467261 [Helianthus anomalus]